MSDLRRYRGIDFELWTGAQSWFWIVLDPDRDSGTIGAASTDSEAARDACLAIDEMLPRPDTRIVVEWELSLSNLERYLAHRCDQAT